MSRKYNPERYEARKKRGTQKGGIGLQKMDLSTSDGTLVLNPRFEEILNYIILNPQHTQKQIAANFGVSAQWIGIIVNTDAFRMRLKEKMDLLFMSAAAPLREKLHSLANQAVDQLADVLEDSKDPEFLLAAMEKTLDRLGYAPAKAGMANTNGVTNQQNIFVSSPEDLAKARSLMHRVQDMKGLTLDIEVEETQVAQSPAEDA